MNENSNGIVDRVPVRQVLISVSDKEGLVQLGRALVELGVKILSTGGTYDTLHQARVPVRKVSDHTGFPEIMDGRVKTLHPKIHGGILGRRRVHDEVAKANGIEYIDAVIVSLYPFEKTIAKEGCTREEAIENIDIGGPGMMRSAAKNHEWVTVVTDPSQYDRFVNELRMNGGECCTSRKLRSDFATRAFARTAQYDNAILQYLLRNA